MDTPPPNTSNTLQIPNKDNSGKNKNIVIFSIFFILALLLIIYVIFVYECWRSKKYIFEPYTPPAPPPNTFYPMGGVVPSTAAEMAAKAALLDQLDAIAGN